MTEARPFPPVIIRGGRILCPQSGVDTVADLVLVDGRVAEQLAAGTAKVSGASVVEADGCWVMPGAVDLDCTLSDPGREDVEDLGATLSAAARGGFTAVLGLPTTLPAIDGGDDVARAVAAAAVLPGAALLVGGALTAGRAGVELAEIGEMAAAGAVCFTDHPLPVVDAGLLRHALEYVTGFSLPVIASGADPALGGDGVIREGPVSTRLGLPALPAAAEVSYISRHIELCRLTGARLHAGPVSTSRGVAALRRAQSEGLPITGAVHPWHLLLDDTAHLARRFDSQLRLCPPLGTAEDKSALIAGIEDGTLLLCSGHAPCSPREKEVEFDLSRPGGVSLPTTLPLALRLCADGAISPAALVRAVSLAPARFLGLSERGHLAVGARADVTVLDPTAPYEITAAGLGTPTTAHPMIGSQTGGAVRATIVAGQRVFGT